MLGTHPNDEEHSISNLKVVGPTRIQSNILDLEKRKDQFLRFGIFDIENNVHCSFSKT